ncbi:MAG TPA: HAMP domain-containing protein, partial [Sediminispirochaeta sp.]|nr:HAMP domain-containing protein [Sediminispirochaeta sp.]
MSKKKGLPIRIHLVIISIVIFILPVLIGGTVLYIQTSSEFEKHIENHLMEQAKLVSQMVEQEYLNYSREILGKESGQSYVEQMYKSKIMDYLEKVEIGERGYIFILDSEGHYVLSEDRVRDGELIIDSLDEDGRFFIREMVENAQELGRGEVRLISYPWRNTKDQPRQEKMAAYTYQDAWGWVIGVSVVMDDYAGGIETIRLFSLAVAVVFILLAIVVATLVGRAYSRPISQLEDIIKQIGSGDLTHKEDLKSSIREINKMSMDFQEQLVEGMRGMLLR